MNRNMKKSRNSLHVVGKHRRIDFRSARENLEYLDNLHRLREEIARVRKRERRSFPRVEIVACERVNVGKGERERKSGRVEEVDCERVTGDIGKGERERNSGRIEQVDCGNLMQCTQDGSVRRSIPASPTYSDGSR